ncbi:TetR family transcriptional regulator C-terminal domain-containing protein [Nocardia altamirensis]|uniref:TetR family transcriptional regulator C-terminal domain-containing protein n=1 Tax=Nocardia altamirensis TaxID=472158 RepID=UPI0008403372|nr:TetR family transcriptional regulator C-terminal domain-containing protein [Nocardia altamirensis]
MLAEVTSILEHELVEEISDIRQAVDRLLSAVPLDDKWFGISLEFTAYAVRKPELRQIMVAREQDIADALLPMIEVMLARAGRQVTDRDALGRAIAAIHDGTMTQCVMEPDNPANRERRTDLFLRVVLSFSTEIESADPPPRRD